MLQSKRARILVTSPYACAGTSLPMLRGLRFLSLTLLLAGLLGLAANAALLSRYSARPRVPSLPVLDSVARTWNGQAIYVSTQEDRLLGLLRLLGLAGLATGAAAGVLFMGFMALRMEPWHGSQPEPE